MRAIKSKNTKPEMLIRSLVHGMGYRYRIHRTDLPGKPDLVFPSRKKVILVHGCFWHGHADRLCRTAHKPKTNTAYWGPKLLKNRRRDKLNAKALSALGWDALTVWECKTKDREAIKAQLKSFLGPLSRK